MPQSATDATRFTSTTPHIYSNIGRDSSSRLPPRKPGPPGETPQEKVRRLKSAAEKAKNAQASKLDRWIAHGRVWTDVAHTIMTTTLIAASIIAGGVTIYAVTDMIIYNRRKKAEYFEEQKAKLEVVIDTARKAIKDGTATEAQIKIIELEGQNQGSTKDGKQESYLLSRAKKLLFSGLKEDGGELEDQNTPSREKEIKKKINPISTVNDNKNVVTSKAKEASAREKQLQTERESYSKRGLDVDILDEKQSKNVGWKTWLFGL